MNSLFRAQSQEEQGNKIRWKKLSSYKYISFSLANTSTDRKIDVLLLKIKIFKFERVSWDCIT